MANLLIINYSSVSPEKRNELITKVSDVAMKVIWDFRNSQIQIWWRWEEENEVQEFLSMLKDIGVSNIIINNEEKESNQQLVESLNFLTRETLKAEEDEKSTVDEQIIPENEPVQEEPKISNEDALKLLFNSQISKYKFTPENSEEMATKLCSEFGIRGEAFRLALTLVGVVPNEAEVYKLLSKTLGKNSARVKMEVAAGFRRWMSNYYPEFFDAHADVKVNDFLNIFREEGKKF